MLGVGVGLGAAPAPAPPVAAVVVAPRKPLPLSSSSSSSYPAQTLLRRNRRAAARREEGSRRWWSDDDGYDYQREEEEEDDQDYQEDEDAFPFPSLGSQLVDEPWFSKDRSIISSKRRLVIMSSQQGQGQQEQVIMSASSSKRRRLETEQQQHLVALGGRYSLQCVRGRGSFAEVWEASHRRTGIKVAIKILCQATAGMPVCKVEREVRVMRLLRHPHIIRFYEAIFTDHHIYIVMELAESGQLHDYVAIQGRLPEAQARAICQQMVAGAAYCHHNMVVHRDLKMENILLDSDNKVKIVDFGFSKLFRYTKFLSKGCGSPDYAAPELHQRRKYIGPPVDVWSCGIILYGMLCGCLPFDGANMSDLRRNILRGEFRMPSFVSDDARDLICSMLIVKPEKRMSMAEVRAHRWLQPDIRPYLAMPPLDACMQQQIVDDETVEQAVTRHGFDRSSLLQSLDDGAENEATVAYNLILSKQFDAATRYLWTMIRRHRQAAGETTVNTRAAAAGGSSRRAPAEMQQEHGEHDESSRRQWALGGFHVLHDCPRQTMRHIAKALHELGILFYSSSCSNHQQPGPGRRRHRMVCAHFPFPFPGGVEVIPSATIIHNFLLLTTNDDDDDALESLSGAVFFEIQVMAGEGNQDHTNYLLDLKRISGPQLPYLRICSQLASMLRPAIH